MQRELKRRPISGLSLCVCLGMLVACSPAHAQDCSVTLNNNAGDMISGTITLATSDPDENGEGEPLIVNTSGGEISNETVDEYNIPGVLVYKANSANETITGTLTGADGDETCSISVSSNAVHSMTADQKKTVNGAALGAVLGGGSLAVMTGIAGAAACEVVTAGFCTGLIIGGGLLAGGGAVLGFISASDPADSNYTVIAKPSPPVITQVTAGSDLSQPEADAFNAFDNNLAATLGIERALFTSENRAQGAHDAGDSTWETRQVQAVQLYAVELGTQFTEQIKLEGALHDALMASGVSISVSPDDVLSFEQQVASNGLPAPFLKELTDLGADQNEIEAVTQALIVQDVNKVAGRFPDLLIAPGYISSLKAAAAALTGVEIEVKPGAGSPAPINPSSNGKIPVALLSGDSFDAGSIDPSTIKFGPYGAENVGSTSVQDVNGDGKPDLVLHFNVQDTGIQPGDTEVVLTGKTPAGDLFSAGEPISTVGAFAKASGHN